MATNYTSTDDKEIKSSPFSLMKAVLIAIGIMVGIGLQPSYTSDFYYNASGLMSRSPNKHFEDSTLPSGGTGYFVLSAAAFQHITNVSITVKDSTTNVANVDIAFITHYNLDTVYYSFVSSNTTLISLIGLSAIGLQIPGSASPGTVLYCRVDGY